MTGQTVHETRNDWTSVVVVAIAVSIVVLLVTLVVIMVVTFVMIMVVVMVMVMVPMIVAWGIFSRSNEIDRPITRMVLMTVPAPVLRMSRRYV
jgi:hypothetical protein